MSDAPVCEYRETHLTVRADTTFDEWIEAWGILKRQHQSINFWVGDFLCGGEDRWPEEWAQAVDGHAVDLYRGAMWVCRKIEPARRREAVSFSAHKELAKLPPEEQDRWLKLIEDNGWTIRQLQEERAAEKARLNGGGYLSNQVPHGTDGAAPDSDIDSKPETRRNASNSDGGEVEALRSLIEDIKASHPADLAMNINSIMADALVRAKFEGWQIDITCTKDAWTVRLRKDGLKHAIGINPHFSAAVAEAILAARISDLSA